MYAMMIGRFPFNDTDKPRLQLKIKHHDEEYPMAISIEAEMIMRGVSIINIKTGIAYARVGLTYALLFSGHVLFFLRPQNLN